MNESSPVNIESLPSAVQLRIDSICNRFEAAWLAGTPPHMEEFCNEELQGPYRSLLVQELILLDVDYRRRRSEVPGMDHYAALPAVNRSWLEKVIAPIVKSGQVTEAHVGMPGSSDDDYESEDVLHLGRYRVERRLGQGGFGVVYLAHDDELLRRVAIKVPHRSHFKLAEAYLNEARTVARLDHPHIVPVYDLGRNENYPCYIV